MEEKIEGILFEKIGELKDDFRNRLDELRTIITEVHADIRMIQQAQQQSGIAIAVMNGSLSRLQVQHDEYAKATDRRLDGHGERITEIGMLVDHKEVSQVHAHPYLSETIPPLPEGMSRPKLDTGLEKRLDQVEKESAEDIKFRATLGGVWKALAVAAGVLVVIYSAVLSTYSATRKSAGNEPKTITVTMDQIKRALVAQASKDDNLKGIPIPSFIQLPAVDAAAGPLEPRFVGKPQRKAIK